MTLVIIWLVYSSGKTLFAVLFDVESGLATRIANRHIAFLDSAKSTMDFNNTSMQKQNAVLDKIAEVLTELKGTQVLSQQSIQSLLNLQKNHDQSAEVNRLALWHVVEAMRHRNADDLENEIKHLELAKEILFRGDNPPKGESIHGKDSQH